MQSIKGFLWSKNFRQSWATKEIIQNTKYFMCYVSNPFWTPKTARLYLIKPENRHWACNTKINDDLGSTGTENSTIKTRSSKISKYYLFDYKKQVKETSTGALTVLVKYRNVKAMVTDCQAVKCNRVYEDGMQDGIKSEGWVLTHRASWRHNNGGVDT